MAGSFTLGDLRSDRALEEISFLTLLLTAAASGGPLIRPDGVQFDGVHICPMVLRGVKCVIRCLQPYLFTFHTVI